MNPGIAQVGAPAKRRNLKAALVKELVLHLVGGIEVPTSAGALCTSPSPARPVMAGVPLRTVQALLGHKRMPKSPNEVPPRLTPKRNAKGHVVKSRGCRGSRDEAGRLPQRVGHGSLLSLIIEVSDPI